MSSESKEINGWDIVKTAFRAFLMSRTEMAGVLGGYRYDPVVG